MEVDAFDGVQCALLTDEYIVSGLEDQSADVIALPRTFRVLSGCDPALEDAFLLLPAATANVPVGAARGPARHCQWLADCTAL